MYVFNFARRFAVIALALLFCALAAHATTTGIESVLFTFPGSQQPSQLIQASDGNFYGTVATNGASSVGYVFRVTPAGSMSVVYSFTGGADGGTPTNSLIEGNDGNLYGTNTTGGVGNGVLYQLTLAGAITVLHTFTAATDGLAAGSLIETTSGDFFGAANSGGASSSGTVFEYSHLGVFSLVHTFTGTASDGSRPNSELVQASDGLIYGVTVRGGSMGAGSIFRFNPADFTTFTTFSSFAPTGQSDPNYNPTFGMTEGTDGALYGLTAEGGTGYGSVYKVVPGTTPTVTFDLYDLVSFSDGGLPASSMTLGGDGNFYATASSYGPGGPPNGTIFQFLPSGTVSLNTLYGFNFPSGNAIGGPIQGFDGNFYGSALGQIYKLVATPAVPAPVMLASTASSVMLGNGFTLNWVVNNAFSQTFQNCQAHGSWSGAEPLSGSLLVTPAAAGTYNYALTCGGVESALVSVTVTGPPTVTATPVITPNGGTFGGPVAYNITDATPGAVIHYTTNGSTPTLASPVWGGVPVVLTSNATVKAIALASPLTVSGVATANFVIVINVDTTCTVNYLSGFNPSTGLSLNHGASVAGSILEMTHGLVNEDTSAFTTKRIPHNTFATVFSFRFENATPASADGLTFTLQANSPLIFGAGGGGLGYDGLPHSMGLKFDLFNNNGEGNNSVGLYFGGAAPTTPAVNLTPSGINLHSGHIMIAYVTYGSQFLTLELLDTVTGKQFTHDFHLPATDPFGASTVYAGFTAATHALTSRAQIGAWYLESAGPCNLR